MLLEQALYAFLGRAGVKSNMGCIERENAESTMVDGTHRAGGFASDCFPMRISEHLLGIKPCLSRIAIALRCISQRNGGFGLQQQEASDSAGTTNVGIEEGTPTLPTADDRN